MSWQAEPAVADWFDRLTFYLRGENRASKSHEVIMWQAARRCAEIVELDETIKALGRVYWRSTRDGVQLKANPAVAQRNEAERHLQSLLAELGLTPASKSRVSADVGGAGAAVNDWADFEGDEAVN